MLVLKKEVAQGLDLRRRGVEIEELKSERNHVVVDDQKKNYRK